MSDNKAITTEINVEDDGLGLDDDIAEIFNDSEIEGGEKKIDRISDDDADDRKAKGNDSDEEEDDEPSDDEDGDDEDGGTKEGKRAAYKARQRAREESEERVRQAERRAEEAERRAAAAESRVATRDEALVESTLESLVADEKILISEMKKAKEEGDTDKELELQGKWTDLKLDIKSASRMKEKIESEKAARASRTDDDDGSSGRRSERQEVQLPEKFKNWLSRNEWIRDPRYVTEKVAMQTIEAELRQKGYDPGTTEFYQRMDRLAAERLPRVAKLQRKSKGYQGNGYVGAGDSGGGRQAEGFKHTKDGKIEYTPTKNDIERMRGWGLDPNNPDHRQEWGRQRIKTIRQENASKAR